MRDIPGSYGTTNRSHIPASIVSAGLYEISPTTLRPDGARPKPIFDLATEAGRAARDAYLADMERSEAAKTAAMGRHLASQGAAEGMFGEGI